VSDTGAPFILSFKCINATRPLYSLMSETGSAPAMLTQNTSSSSFSNSGSAAGQQHVQRALAVGQRRELEGVVVIAELQARLLDLPPGLVERPCRAR
jgi:hypothetical protein